MANGGVDLDELLNARARLNAQKERSDPLALDADELSLVKLLGLWVLLTLLIVIHIVMAVVTFIVTVASKVAEDSKQRKARKP